MIKNISNIWIGNGKRVGRNERVIFIDSISRGIWRGNFCTRSGTFHLRGDLLKKIKKTFFAIQIVTTYINYFVHYFNGAKMVVVISHLFFYASLGHFVYIVGAGKIS